MIPDFASLQALINLKYATAAPSRKLSSLQKTIPHSWIDYIVKLAKHPVEVNGVKYEPYPRVVLSPLFFRNYTCACCGRCCFKTDTLLFYTDTQLRMCGIQAAEVEALGFERTEGILNIRTPAVDHAVRLFVSRWNVNGRCPLLMDNNHCRIHKHKPLQCTLTPIHFDTRGKGKSLSITKRLFGRNWKFGCEMKPIPITPEALADDLYKLDMLYRIAQDLKIDTWFPELLGVLMPYAAPSHPCWQSGGPMNVTATFVSKYVPPIAPETTAPVDVIPNAAINKLDGMEAFEAGESA